MLLRVIVETAPRFRALGSSTEESTRFSDASASHGRIVFEVHGMASIATPIRGHPAAERPASVPDLTHLMTRETIGAGVAMNTPAHLKDLGLTIHRR